MKKTSAKQVMTYVLLVGLLVLIAVYFLVYKAYNDKAAAIRTSNVSLTERVNELKVYYDDMEAYQTEIDLMQSDVNAMLDVFPADVREEDILVLAIDTEKNLYINYSNINIGAREAVYTIPAEKVQTAGMENLTGDIIFVKRGTSYVNVTDYANLKNCVQMINDSSDKLSINNITYSRNSDSTDLEGTIEVIFYSVMGTGKEYVPQNLPQYESGLSNLFGIVETE
ncbi:MAG: hypothetical protein ACI4EV_03975 [Lachnospiraceae bacterium]